MYYLRDFKTKARVETTNLIFAGNDSPWEVVMDLERVRSLINMDYFRVSPPLVSKYLPFLPIKDYGKFVSLGEGATPLIRSKRLGPALGINLYFKLESQNPTGAFKDRGSAVELTIAKELNAKGITVASTGSMAASCSCYAAAAQIPCFVFVPEGTPSGKLSQVIAYGGRIVQVKGNYNDAVHLARSVAEKLNFYLAGDYAFRVEGQKTAAFELLDQFFFSVPDLVFVPIGCGTNITAYGKGFREYRDLGFVDRLPQLVGVQSSGASPVVDSIKRQEHEVKPLKHIDSICSAIAIGDPLDGIKALEAIYATNGFAESVTDTETLESQYQLSKEEGLYVESSAATTLAALVKVSREQDLRGKTVVLIITGGGLKDPSAILKIAIKPPIITPKLEEFLSLYENSFFEGRSVAFVDKREIIFSSPPEKLDVKHYLKEQYGVEYSDDYVEKIHINIVKFLKKGKPITFSDFQDIVQDARETLRKAPVSVFTVLDFEVRSAWDKQAEASVLVKVNGSEKRVDAQGVGPVDAVVNALRKACGKEFEFTLEDYKVDVRSQGTDAVVYVELKLAKPDVVSVGKATSPDVIQASIQAFEDAYNGFYC